MCDKDNTAADNASLLFADNQTEELIRKALKRDWTELQYVKDQTEDICSFAIKQNPSALMYVKDQTPGLCIQAVLAPPVPKGIEKHIKDEALKEDILKLRFEKDRITLEEWREIEKFANTEMTPELRVLETHSLFERLSKRRARLVVMMAEVSAAHQPQKKI